MLVLVILKELDVAGDLVAPDVLKVMDTPSATDDVTQNIHH